ncbi:class I SAM-dependent methyltransferase [Allorhizocola rhizosphaerae]|uniref:class I SAM-dependent methyltransferase n=1 Tax=Allorhizocola rhizosphaerae TaxID=1872709 RepID=UPI000E3CC2C8|nr:class I SAM-dependent methyltransferase [Allorhizocola rhizosphaerae]
MASTSLVYRSASGYELVMRMLYGRHYTARYEAISARIPGGSSVLDVCCGPAVLYHRYLKAKSVRYTGLDINEGFVRRLGANGLQRDLLADDSPLPEHDFVVMQASLYHFLPDPGPVVDMLLAAARSLVIITEPVRNLANSDVKLVAMLGRRLTDPGTGEQASRFTEATLDAFMSRYSAHLAEATLIAGGREKLIALRPA